MTAADRKFVTQAEVCGLLESLCPVTERTLEDWRRRDALPSLVRQPLGPGCGRGAVYGWTNSEILVQVATLKLARDTHSRLQWMKLAAWFAGFDYPHDEMREAWKWLCRRRGVEALAKHLSWPTISNAEVPEAIKAFYDHLLPSRQKTPATLAFLRADLDPAFTGPSRAALDGARQLWQDQWQDHSSGDVPELLVRTHFDVQRAFGSASVEAALAEVTTDQFAQAHRDARFLLTPLRLVAVRMIESGDGAAETLLFLLPKLGHQLHKAALILRHAGHGERIDTTICSLRVFSATPVIQEAFWEAVIQVRAMLLTSNDPPEAVARFAEYWDDPELRAAVKTAWSAVKDAWVDLVGPLVDDFLAALNAELSPEADHPLELA